MSNPERKVMDCLFEGRDVKIDNVKFFRGTDTLIDEDRFEAEFCASVQRRDAPKAGISSAPPACVKGPLDLRALIAEM